MDKQQILIEALRYGDQEYDEYGPFTRRNMLIKSVFTDISESFINSLIEEVVKVNDDKQREDILCSIAIVMAEYDVEKAIVLASSLENFKANGLSIAMISIKVARYDVDKALEIIGITEHQHMRGRAIEEFSDMIKTQPQVDTIINLLEDYQGLRSSTILKEIMRNSVLVSSKTQIEKLLRLSYKTIHIPDNGLEYIAAKIAETDIEAALKCIPEEYHDAYKGTILESIAIKVKDTNIDKALDICEMIKSFENDRSGSLVEILATSSVTQTQVDRIISLSMDIKDTQSQMMVLSYVCKHATPTQINTLLEILKTVEYASLTGELIENISEYLTQEQLVDLYETILNFDDSRERSHIDERLRTVCIAMLKFDVAKAFEIANHIETDYIVSNLAKELSQYDKSKAIAFASKVQ